MKNKFGFTLAEVLITLVIIGVVAALTIPTAINKYREQTLKSQFAKAYSTISQALNKTEMNDFYGYAKCYYTNTGALRTECSSLFSKLFQNLSVQKTCRGNAKNDGCVPTYQTYCPNSSCSSFSENGINNGNHAAVLSDGMLIIVAVSTSDNTNLFPIILVDINGHKGPNAYGKDLFGFNLKINDDNTNVAINLPAPLCEFPVEGGKTTAQMIQYALVKK